jgi:D-methionine transport system substrate-binding protein
MTRVGLMSGRSARHILIACLFILPLFAGCHRNNRNVLRIGVTPCPAEEVLESVRSDLHNQGIDLKIIHFTDYIQPNLALSGHDLDANLYQNIPFMEQFNQARGLHLLENAGILVLRPGLDNRATVADVAQNPHHLVLVELDASQLPRSREDVDLTVINANFALDAGLNPSKDAIFRESVDSVYVNVLSVNSGDQTDDRIVKLGAALRSEVAKAFITSHYKGAIYPAT